MKMVIMSLLSLVAVSAFADSQYLDSAALTGCGGKVELRLADNGDLALKFSDNGYSQFSSARCPNLRFVDASTNTVIKEYEVKGTSYTLSAKMRDSLSSDCKVKAQFDNGHYTTQFITVRLTGCRPAQAHYPTNPFSYELSNKNNCKLLVNGVYTNGNNVDAAYCNPLQGDKNAVLKYEYSNSGNCKIMINGQFMQQMGFADKFYCSARH